MIGFGCTVYNIPMSLVIALRDDKDIIVASDGRVLDLNLAVLSNETHKTLPINDGLIISLTGHTDYMVQILWALGFRCSDTTAVNLMRVCEEDETPVEIEYRDARNIITRELARIVPNIEPEHRKGYAPSAILAGKMRDVPALCSWGEPTWEMNQWPLNGFSASIIGKIPPIDSEECHKFRITAYGNHKTDGAESRLVEAIRSCADYWGEEGPVNKVVFLRRLSSPFQLTRAQ